MKMWDGGKVAQAGRGDRATHLPAQAGLAVHHLLQPGPWWSGRLP